jgi:uncharacterized Zn finger protein
MTTPTLDTITTAFIKAAQQGHNYDVILRNIQTPAAGGGADYMVSHKREYKTRTYFVSVYTATEKTTCSCPEHGRSGFCKHAAQCVSDLQTRQAEAEYDQAEDARYDQEAGKH